MRTDPSNTNAAFYQSGGSATFGTGSSSLLVVGDYGTATSLYDLSGGTMNASYGVVVGIQGNGVLNIDGGVANIKGGLVVGEDSSLATAGLVSLSSGSLNVTGGINLGNGGGIGTFYHSGGTLSVGSGLLVGGTATLILDDTNGSVATSVTGTLTRQQNGTLVIVPQNGHLGSTEGLSFTQPPAPPNGTSFLGAFAVAQSSGNNSSGDYLTTTGNSVVTATYSYGLAGASYSTIASVTGSSSVGQDTYLYAVKFADSTVTTLASTNTLTVYGCGMILNGGTLAGGAVAFYGTPLLYAGSNDPAAISSSINCSMGLVKFGPGTLVLSGTNTGLSGNIYVNSGVLNIQNPWALGAIGTGNTTIVAAGASLQIQGNTAVGGNAITLNGTGLNGTGAIQNVQGSNSFGGPITLNSNSQITVSDTLTLSGYIQGGYDLTKTGSGTLVLTGVSTLFGAMNIAEGTVTAANSGALGLPGGVGATVYDGATLQLQGGIAVPNVPITLNGTGTNGNAALENLQGSNSLAGAITLGSDSQVNVDNAADRLTLSGTISGGCALTVSGAGTLLLSGNNTFTGGLTVLSGTVSVPNVSMSGSAGPLGASAMPVVLGGDSNAATLLYTGGGTTSNQAFTMGAGGGVFAVNSSLGLSGVIDGGSNFTKTGSGTLTLSGSNLYTGTTTISNGVLAVSNSGSINSTSGIVVTQGGLLQVTGGSGSQLPDSGNIALSGGSINYIGNGSASPGELTGALLLNPGQSSITISNTGSGSSYLRFAGSGTATIIGATVNFAASSTNASIQFQGNPPSGSIIGGYAYYSNGGSVDFATLTASGSNGPYTVAACTNYYGSDLGTLASSGTVNAKPTGSQSSIGAAKELNSLDLTGSIGVTMTGSGSLKLDSGGLIANTTGNITGGTITGSSSGELTINVVQSLSIGSVIADNGGPPALVKTGSGTVTLTGSNTYTGNTYLNQGTIAYSLSNDLSYGGAISGIGGLNKSGTATLTLTGNNSYSGPTTISGGGLVVNGSLGAGSTVTVQNTAVLSGSGIIGGGVVLSGGTINLSSGGSICGASTASGGYWLGAGSVGGLLTVPSGTFTIGSTSGTTNLTAVGGLSVTGTGAINFASSVNTLTGSLNYASSISTTLVGIIAGNGSSVTLNNSATVLGLSGSNTYGGGTNVAAGTLQADSATAFGSGRLTVSGGTVDLNGNSYTFASLAGSTSGVLTNSSTAATVTVSMTGGSTIYGGAISGSGNHTLALVLSGSGALTLSGTNSYSGGTTVTSGTLNISSEQALPSAGVLVVGRSGRVVLGNTHATGASSPAVLIASSSLLENASSSQALPSMTSSIDSGLPTPGSDPVLVSESVVGVVGTVAGTAGAQSVPEPGTFVLILAAISGLGLIQLRRRIKG